jgi:hypothetical protein
MNELDRFYREFEQVSLTAEQEARFAPSSRLLSSPQSGEGELHLAPASGMSSSDFPSPYPLPTSGEGVSGRRWELLLPVAAAAMTLVMLFFAQRSGGDVTPRTLPGIGGPAPMEMVTRPPSNESSSLEGRTS